ncbi:MAG: hypothetical protein COT74_02525 [Bdellovibrionales bacterium CG10_big_fil_rev_8_21_14_0_10_45_34]|nr:MAG: hypothetical protein COT74_02525 [Bdellovibrionales bacterium CG10_big_fil_rev_8_21_14_0_10_45_34]
MNWRRLLNLALSRFAVGVFIGLVFSASSLPAHEKNQKSGNEVADGESNDQSAQLPLVEVLDLQLNHRLHSSIARVLYNLRINEGERWQPPEGEFYLEGSILAAPHGAFDPTEKKVQIYRFHWVRDGALVVKSLIRLMTLQKLSAQQATDIEKFVKSYITTSKIHQAHLHQPKFYLDGQPFTDPWGRPQNDGPALRQLAMFAWYDYLIEQGREEEIPSLFFEFSTVDLNYVSEKLNDLTFDIWEEVLGRHYATLLVQRNALKKGAQLAKKLGNDELAEKYLRSSQEATAMLERCKRFSESEENSMKIKHSLSVMALFGTVCLLGCQKNEQTPQPAPTFEQKMAAAKARLSSTTTGAQSLAVLKNLENSGSIASIDGIESATESGHQGGIRENENGSFSILLPQAADADSLAHALIHETSHIYDEISMKPVMAEYPEVNAAMEELAKAIKEKRIAGYVDSDEKEMLMEFFVTSLLFSEVKAYQTNLALEKEGISFNNQALKKLGLVPYVTEAYLPKGVNVSSAKADNGEAFLAVVNQYDNLGDFQRVLLEKIQSIKDKKAAEKLASEEPEATP